MELIQIGVITRKDIKSVKDIIKTLSTFGDLKGEYTDEEIKAVVTILIAEEIADYKTLISITRNREMASKYFTELLAEWREKQEDYKNVSDDFFYYDEEYYSISYIKENKGIYYPYFLTNVITY